MDTQQQYPLKGRVAGVWAIPLPENCFSLSRLQARWRETRGCLWRRQWGTVCHEGKLSFQKARSWRVDPSGVDEEGPKFSETIAWQGNTDTTLDLTLLEIPCFFLRAPLTTAGIKWASSHGVKAVTGMENMASTHMCSAWRSGYRRSLNGLEVRGPPTFYTAHCKITEANPVKELFLWLVPKTIFLNKSDPINEPQCSQCCSWVAQEEPILLLDKQDLKNPPPLEQGPVRGEMATWIYEHLKCSRLGALIDYFI